jgi:molybdopterin-binding protein
MNRIEALVAEVRHVESLYVVSFEWYNATIKMVSLDLDHQLKEGDKVVLGVNFTSVALAKGLMGELSYTNQLGANISEIDRGELMSVITLSYGGVFLESLILTDSVDRLALKAGDDVTMIIKANDIFLQEVIS